MPPREKFIIKKFPVPPRGFNVTRASPKRLARYGLPARPDPDIAPVLYKVWLQTFSNRLRFISPVLKARKSSGVRPPLRQRSVSVNANTNALWSGSVVAIAASDRVFPYLVTGTWQVPLVSVPANSTANVFKSSMWVGIDGFGGTDVFQAGTGHEVRRSGVKTYSAWFEWFESASPQTTGAKVFSNFPISAGDFISCWLQVFTPFTGIVILVNLKKNTITLVGMTVPTGFAGLTGDSVEWILERRAFVDSNAKIVPYDLPQYTTTFFALASGLTLAPKTFGLNDGTLLSMSDAGKLISTPTLNGITLTRSD